MFEYVYVDAYLIFPIKAIFLVVWSTDIPKKTIYDEMLQTSKKRKL